MVHVRRVTLDLRRVVVTALMGVLAAAALLPLGWMLSSSLKLPGEVFEFPIRWIPRSAVFRNYRDVLMSRSLPMLLFLWNSLKVAVATVVGLLFVSSAAAYAFARLEFRGRSLLFLAYLATLMIPHQVIMIPKFVLFRWFGIYDTHLALILPGFFNVLGVFLLRQFLLTIPADYTAAAQVDGAGHLRIWWQVVLPLARPAILSLTVLSFITVWNDYINPIIYLTSKRLYTVPLGLHFLVDIDSGFQDYNLQMAAASMATLPVLVVFLAAQRLVIEGITATGIKG